MAKNTIVKLLLDLGIACSDYQDRTLRNLTCERIQVDEIWSFIGAKKANVKPEQNPDYGDAWTFVCIDPDTKLVPSTAISCASRRRLARLQLMTVCGIIRW